MFQPFATTLYTASTWVIPLVITITFHEASHGYVARLCGDEPAWRLGRVTFNPFKHIDPFGTILLPALLVVMRSPILFGYAKPVPVNFQGLRNPRRDSILVAAAGPVMNFALATLAALAFHVLIYLPDAARPWVAENLKNTLIINVLLAIFNLLPLPPLDGGRIAVGVLPDRRFQGHRRSIDRHHFTYRKARHGHLGADRRVRERHPARAPDGRHQEGPRAGREIWTQALVGS
jgi:Zn-dependent protease